MDEKFSHLDENGNVRMINVSEKLLTKRKAVASGSIVLKRATFDAIRDSSLPKGNVLTAAKIAGIMAAKKTDQLIPMCHPLNITFLDIEFTMDEKESAIHIKCTAEIKAGTGVEMEALTGVSVAALTIYDMCKSMDKSIVINNIRLVEKHGGKSGTVRLV